MTALLRAGDADREATAAVLRRAHEEGRLDTGELEDRLERCYAAKTVADLDPLVDDLPRPRRRSETRRPHMVLLPLLVCLLIVGIAVSRHAFVVFPLLFFVFMRFGWRRPRWR